MKSIKAYAVVYKQGVQFTKDYIHLYRNLTQLKEDMGIIIQRGITTKNISEYRWSNDNGDEFQIKKCKIEFL